METPDVIDKIYEAALIPEKWESVLVGMNDVIGTRGCTVFTRSGIGSSFMATPEAAEYARRYFDEAFHKINNRIERGVRLDHAGFVTDLDFFDEHELANEPFYRDFLYPAGLGWCAGTFIMPPNGDMIVASFDGAFASGPISRDKIEWLDTLRPHLARALSMTARLNIQMASSIAEGLGALGLAACVVNARGRVLSENALMHTVIPSVVLDRRDGVTLRHGPSGGLLQNALLRLSITSGIPDVMSIPVPASDDEPASVVHIIPVRGNGRDLFPNGLFILTVSHLASSTLPDATILRGLFDLTPAEAKVARLAANGVAPKAIGAFAGIKSSTVKTHLKSIYAKTGVDHHGALVRLLSGTPMPKTRSF